MTQDFLGTGLRFPFRFDPRTGGVQGSAPKTATDPEHLRQSILQILRTQPGERFLRPEFGSRLHELVFEPDDEVLKGLVRHHVFEAVRRWEKRVVVTDVSFEEPAEGSDPHVLPVKIAYRVLQGPVEGTLVYPFHREPSAAPAPTDLSPRR